MEQSIKEEIHEFECGMCGAIYLTENECISHYEHHTVTDIDTELREEVVESSDYVIPDQVFQEIEIEYEEAVELTEYISPKNKIRPKIEKCFQCEECGKEFKTKTYLKSHQRRHTGEKPYQCDICLKRFSLKMLLQVHIRTHTGERPFQCPQCPKAFSIKTALLRHNRVHTGEKPFACPTCHKTFTQSNSMKLHVATVHLKQPAPYKKKSNSKRKTRRPNKALEVDENMFGIIHIEEIKQEY